MYDIIFENHTFTPIMFSIMLILYSTFIWSLSHTWSYDLVYCRVHTDIGKGTMAKPVARLLDLASGSTASSLEE